MDRLAWLFGVARLIGSSFSATGDGKRFPVAWAHDPGSRGLPRVERNGLVMASALVSKAALVATVGMMAVAAYGEPQPVKEELTLTPAVAQPVPAANPNRNLSGYFSVNMPTAYISYGAVFNHKGFITQPAGELDFAVYEGEGSVSKVTVLGGLWADLNSAHEGSPAGHALSGFYELDWYAGVSIDFAKHFSALLSYTEFTSPSGAFNTSKAVSATLSYDDSESMGKLALHPYVKLMHETEGKVTTGVRNGGQYLELGIAPGMELSENTSYPVTITFPVAVGMGFNDFYDNGNGDNETLGFASIGAVATIPLTFMNSGGWGTWSANAGVYCYYFGDGVHDANTGIGVSDREYFVGQVGVKCEF